MSHALLGRILLRTVCLTGVLSLLPGCIDVGSTEYVAVPHPTAEEQEPSSSPATTAVPQPAATGAEDNQSGTASTDVASKSNGPAAAQSNKADNTVKPDSGLVQTSAAVESTSTPPADKTFPVVGPEGAIRVGFDDIDLEKILNIPTVTDAAVDSMPDWLRKLDGKRVRMRGYMIPAFQDTDLHYFVLARDTSACCFGPNPKVCYLIEVAMRKGHSTDYIHYRQFDVVGTFHVGNSATPGQLYTIDDAIVIQK